jgi:hypothetical protein
MILMTSSLSMNRAFWLSQPTLHFSELTFANFGAWKYFSPLQIGFWVRTEKVDMRDSVGSFIIDYAGFRSVDDILREKDLLGTFQSTSG